MTRASDVRPAVEATVAQAFAAHEALREALSDLVFRAEGISGRHYTHNCPGRHAITGQNQCETCGRHMDLMQAVERAREALKETGR